MGIAWGAWNWWVKPPKKLFSKFHKGDWKDHILKNFLLTGVRSQEVCKVTWLNSYKRLENSKQWREYRCACLNRLTRAKFWMSRHRARRRAHANSVLSGELQLSYSATKQTELNRLWKENKKGWVWVKFNIRITPPNLLLMEWNDTDFVKSYRRTAKCFVL